MLCNGAEYLLNSGDLVIFNPYDIHSCKNFSAAPLYYKALNIEKSFMEGIFNGNLPSFQNVIKSVSPDIFKALDDTSIARLLKVIPFEYQNKDFTPEIQKICKIIEQNLSNKISLDFLVDAAGLSKSTILREFAKQKGITPYRYIENLRINKAKTLLDKGLTPLDAALEAGFSSQSHFSNSFKTMIGLAPSKYQKEAAYV